MPKKMTKSEKQAFSAGCRVGARKAKQSCRKTQTMHSRYHY